MKVRTAILTELIAAAKGVDDARDALTRAYVALQRRNGPEAADAFSAVTAARDLAYEPELADLIEKAITETGRLP